MTLINSSVAICNLAIGHLGLSNRVASINNPKTKEEKDCALYYDITRQGILESFDWSFAKSRESLSASSETPAFKWSYKSDIFPVNLLRFNALHYSDGTIIVNTNRQYYEVEGRQLLTSLNAPYYISYIKDVTTVSEMSKLFIMLFSYSLAKELYKSLGASGTTLQIIQEQYKEYEIKAISVNSAINPPVVISSSNYDNERTNISNTSEIYS